MAKNTLIFLMALCFLSTAAVAQSREAVIGPPLNPVFFGTRVSFPIYFHNAGTQTEIALPPTLRCVLSHQESSVSVTADRIAPDEAFALVDAGGYTKALYALDMPASVTGTVRLSVPDLEGAGMMFEVQTKEPAFGTTTTGRELVELTGEALDLSVFINAYQPYARNISFYQPMYFLLGLDPEETKFQISFKYRFFNPEQPFAQRHPWIRNFYFGYTQTSFWDLDSDSRPFEDTSYKPELFFQSMNIDTGISWIRGLFVQTGFEHESNGNSADRSRSTNYVYLEPSIIFLKRAELIGLRIAPRFWAYVNNSDRTNPDLYAYRGYYSLRLTFGQANSIICDTHFGFAEKGRSVRVNLTYPLHRLLHGNFDFYLHLQYINALGESLLNYTDRTEGVRIGLAIVR